jgi:DNA polymerase-3 subunit beta
VCFKKKNIYFAATDSFRLSEKIINTEKTYEKKAIIPRKTSDAITRIFQNPDLNNTVSIQVNNNQILIKNSTVTFVSRIIEGDYPNYEQIIPNKFTTEINTLKEELVQHIKTAGLFSNKINEITLEANPKKQSIEISSQDQERGDHYSSIPCEVEGIAVRAIFNYQYLLEGIQNISSGGIKIKLNEPTNPVLITSEENDGLRYVVMPIKI